jgi:hypothetical protein
MDRAEVYKDGSWERVIANEVLKMPKPILRCPACHGEVIAVRSYYFGGRARFSHRRAFPACAPDQEGRSPLHPDAIA